MTIDERIELHKQWLQRTNDAPLVDVFAPSGDGGGGGRFDVDVAPGDIVARKLRGIEAGAAIPTDKLPVALVDFGTPLMPALAGAGFQHDGINCWALPCAESILDLRVQPFDASHPLWLRYVTLFEKLLDHWSWDTYLPGICAMLGPMDILSGMLGPETLAMEMMLHPDEVRTAAVDAAELFMAVHREHVVRLREAGLEGGTVDWMKLWLPGDGTCYSEDYSALVGPRHVREFFRKPNGRIMAELDTAMLHVHSAASASLPEIIDLPGIDAIEISNDRSGPDLDELIDLGRSVQAAGLALQMSNWQHPLAVSEIEKLLASLDSAGLIVTLQASSVEETGDLYALVKQSRE